MPRGAADRGAARQGGARVQELQVVSIRHRTGGVGTGCGVAVRFGVDGTTRPRWSSASRAATLSSYLGHFKLANSWRLWRSIWREFPFLGEYFGFDAAAWKLVRHFADAPRFSTVRDQYAWFCRRYPGHAVLMQVGGFVEFYGEAGRAAGERLGLRPMRVNRRPLTEALGD